MHSAKLIRGLQLYFSSIILYSLGILLFRNFSYFQKFLSAQTQTALLYLFLGYAFIAPLAYLIFIKEYSENKPYLFFRALLRNLKNIPSRKFHLEKEEKVAILFILVKLFFLPTMLNFFFGNMNGVLSLRNFFSIRNFNWFHVSFTILFTIDTLIFSIGYAFELRHLKNTVRSVEPTFFGWFVALICYPPFNSIAGTYIPWGANDYVQFWNPALTLIFRIMLLLLLIIYVWATVALGLKSSNLTNRGIVTKFPYSIIRHPAYISKNLLWWITLLPVMNTPFALGMAFWSIIYFFRAYTEERHLMQDSDYVKYCEKVKYKFIPYLI